MSFKRVVKFCRNQFGRDFVVGDIHGSFDSLWAAMKAVNFNPEYDRLFFVGDLIDRGAGSFRCVKFLALPYVFGVRGNHEQMLIDACEEAIAGGDDEFDLIQALSKINWNGMHWLRGIDKCDLLEVIASISKLPIAIEIESDRGTIGLVHADVPMGMDWGVFLEKIEAGDKHVTDFALGLVDCSRDRINEERLDGVSGVGRLFVGHTTQFDGLKSFGNVYGIDTGACFGEAGKAKNAHLTMANVNMSTGLLMAPREVTDNPLIDVRFPNDSPNHSFFNMAEVA